MRGFPKYINTRQDLEHVAVDYPHETRAYMQEIYDTRHQWVVLRKLDDDEEGVVNDTAKVVESPSMNDDAVSERYQYELIEDPNGTIFRLGFGSSDEFLALINTLQE